MRALLLLIVVLSLTAQDMPASVRAKRDAIASAQDAYVAALKKYAAGLDLAPVEVALGPDPRESDRARAEAAAQFNNAATLVRAWPSRDFAAAGDRGVQAAENELRRVLQHYATAKGKALPR